MTKGMLLLIKSPKRSNSLASPSMTMMTTTTSFSGKSSKLLTKPIDPSSAVGAVEHGSIEEEENYFGPENHRPNKMGRDVEPGECMLGKMLLDVVLVC